MSIPNTAAQQAAHVSVSSATRSTQVVAQDHVGSSTQVTDHEIGKTSAPYAPFEKLLNEGDQAQESVVQLRSHEQLLHDLFMPCDPGYDPKQVAPRDLLIGVMIRDDQATKPTAWELKKPSIDQIVAAVSDWLSEFMPHYVIRRGDRHIVEAYAEELLDSKPQLILWTLPCVLNSDIPYGISGSYAGNLPTKAASHHFRNGKGSSTLTGPFELAA